jgi:hypothetical protein
VIVSQAKQEGNFFAKEKTIKIPVNTMQNSVAFKITFILPGLVACISTLLLTPDMCF